MPTPGSPSCKAVRCGRPAELTEHDALPALERIHYLDPAGVQDYANPMLSAMPAVPEDRAGLPEELRELVQAIDPDRVVARSYTSGTSGQPQPVMLTHRNLFASAEAAVKIFELGSNDRVMSFRALSDPVERGATVLPALLSGAVLVLPESRASVGQAMVEIQPTYLHLTPRYLEEIAPTSGYACSPRATSSGWCCATGTRAWSPTSRRAGPPPRDRCRARWSAGRCWPSLDWVTCAGCW